MTMLNPSSRRPAPPDRGPHGDRLRASRRRRARSLRPVGEGLEERALLSVGLDPTWGFGGIAELNQPSSTTTNGTTTSYSTNLDAIALQNGQVVAVGSLATQTYSNGSYQSSTNSLFVTRLNTDGTVDTSFGSNGTENIPVVSGGVTYNVTGDDIAVQSNGDIDVLGLASPPSGSSTTTDQWVIAQLNPGGSLNTAFGTSGIALINFGTSSNAQNNLSASSLAIAPSGKIVAVGTTSLANSGGSVFAVAQLNTNGTLDTTFNTTGLTTVNFKVGTASAENDTANDVVIQPDGAIIVVGSAQLPTTSSSTYPYPTDEAVARLTSAGALDTTFNGTGMLTFNQNVGGSASDDSASAVTLSGTQIVIAGTSNFVITPSSSTSASVTGQDLTVTRLNANGSPDTTFNGSGKFVLSLSQDGTTFDTSASSVIARPSGALLIGGSASERNTGGYSYGGPSGGLLLSLTPTGGLDTTFGNNGAAIIAGADIDGSMPMQADGKLDFITSQGIARTTAPAPAPAVTTIVTTGTGKSAKASGVSITFNTAVNAALLNNPSLYTIRTVKGHKLIKIKKRGISYDAATQTLTLSFAGKTAVGKGFTVTIVTGGIIAADGQVLPPTPILIAPSTTTT